MKILNIIIILVLISRGFVYAQQNTQASNSIEASDLKHPLSIKGNNITIKDSILDKYVGTWVWKNDANSLTITFTKKTIHYGSKNNVLDADILIGQYRYLSNGKEVSSSSDNYLSGSSGGKKDTINLFITNNSSKKTISLFAMFLNNHSFRLELDNNRFESGKDGNFEFPSPVVLTKEK